MYLGKRANVRFWPVVAVVKTAFGQKQSFRAIDPKQMVSTRVAGRADLCSSLAALAVCNIPFSGAGIGNLVSAHDLLPLNVRWLLDDSYP